MRKIADLIDGISPALLGAFHAMGFARRGAV
jgi:hypothetical protein